MRKARFSLAAALFKFKAWRMLRKLKKLVIFHRWLDQYMALTLGWPRSMRKQFWNDFIKSPAARESNYRRIYFRILKEGKNDKKSKP